MAEEKAAPSFKLQVDTGGNPRKGSISVYPEEVQQCVLDIVSWFDRAGGEHKGEDVPGATASEIELLESSFGPDVPEALVALLRARNGGMFMYEYAVLTAEEAVATAAEHAGSRVWEEGSIPVGRDADGNLLLVLGRDGSVREWDAEDGVSPEPQAPRFGAYLEALRDKILSHRVELVDGVGVVETQASPARRAPAGK